MIGAGQRDSNKGMTGVAIGGGFGGIYSGHIPFAWLLSMEAYAIIELPANLQAMAYVRPTWTFSEPTRVGGSSTLGFVDELTAGITLTRIPKHHEGNFISGSGYGLRLFVKEQLGIRMFGIGFGMAAADASE